MKYPNAWVMLGHRNQPLWMATLSFHDVFLKEMSFIQETIPHILRLGYPTMWDDCLFDVKEHMMRILYMYNHVYIYTYVYIYIHIYIYILYILYI